MTFFYDLNKKLAGIDKPAQQLNESVVAEKWDTETKVSPEEKGKYAGKSKAELLKSYNALKASGPHKKGSDAYGRMRELAFAIRAKGDWGKVKEEGIEEGFVDTVKQGAQSALQAIGSTLGHGSDEDMIRDLQKKAGVPVTGKVQPQQGQQQGQQQKPMAEDDMEEGNAFSKAVVDAKKDGIQPGETIKVGGKTYPVKEGKGSKPDFLDVDKDGNKKETFKKAVADKKKGNKEEELDEGFGDMMATAGAKLKGLKANITKNPKDRQAAMDAHRGIMKKELSKVQPGDRREIEGPSDRYNKAQQSYAMHKIGLDNKMEEGWDDMMKAVKARADKPKVGDVEHGAKHDIEHTATGRRVTRRVDDKGMSVGAEDDKPADGEKRGRGRPKKADKAPERVTSKAYKHKGERKVKEGVDQGQAQQIYNDLADIRAAAKQAQGGGQFPQGFASRLESALWAAMTLIKNQQSGGAQVREEQVDEKAVSKAQQRFMGMAHAMQKGEKIPGASKELKKVAKTMKKGDVKDYAKTKHAGLPEKKKKEETDESTVSGSVATSTEAPKSKKGGSIVGKGIYDSLNRDLEAMIAESMNVSVNMSVDEHGEPHKNITVSAEGDEAEKLAQLLNLAGVAAKVHDEHDEVCPACGSADCGCNEEVVDENAPDWPTEPETTGADDPHLNRWAGGLNKPKETGQTTIPVVNRDPRRGSFGPAEYATDVRENKDLGMSLYAELQSFKAK